MKSNRFFFTALLLLLLTFLSGHGRAQNTAREALQEFLHSKSLAHAGISISILDATDGSVLLEHDPSRSLSPASVQKLVTTSTALEVLGSEFRFMTVLAYTGELNDHGVLDGSLVILGGGDPALQSEYAGDHYPESLADHWVGAVRKAGIKKIRGAVLGDAARYDSQAVPDGWSWDDVGNYYGAGVFGLTYRDNLQRITFDLDEKPGQPAHLLRTVPEIPYAVYNNEVLSSEEQSDNSYVYGGAYSSERWIRGSLPTGRKEFTIKASIPDPPFLLAEMLQKKLQASGITCDGFSTSLRTKEERFYDKRTGLDTLYSPPLSEIVRMTNFESLNLFAEHLVKELGLRVYGDSRFSSGLEAIEEHWKDRLPAEGVYLTDGSGLSRSNALPSAFLSRLLWHMTYRSPEQEAFTASLPQAGEEGTMRYYFKESPLRRRLLAKSGSMKRIRSFAGTFTTQNGREIVFVIIANNFSCTSMIMARQMEAFLEELDRIL